MTILLKKLLYFVVLSYTFVLSEGCDGLSKKYGNMTKDHEIEVNNSTVIECTLFNSTIDLNGTEYNVTSENLAIKFEGKFLEKVEAFDPFTIHYEIRNASSMDSGMYSCFLVIPGLSYKPLVCSSFLQIGYKPLPILPEDFQCLSLHYRNLTCSWKKPVNGVKTDYAIFDVLRPVNAIRKCPQMIDDSTCQWTVNSYPPYRLRAKTLYFIIEGNNSLGTSKQHIQIDHYKRVKPSEPKSLSVNDLTKNSVRLRWLQPREMDFESFSLSYWIYYYSTSNPSKTYKEINVQNATSYLVKDLMPFTVYVFSLRCRPSVADSDDVWSAFVNITLRTKSDVPYLSPELLSSAFEVQNFQGDRAITLYWKTIPPEHENGDEFQYVIHYHLHSTMTRLKRSNFPDVMVGNVSTFTFKHMDQNSTYLFKIFARNKFGPSDNSSVIIVENNSNLLDLPKDISVLAHGHGNYTISWKPPQKAKNGINNYTLFWCPDIRPRPFKCEGPIQWMFTNDSSQELDFLDQDTNYQFAIAANSLLATSGMEWASCVVPYSGVLYKVKRVILTPKNSTSIKVRWSLDCPAQRDVIQEYRISYCPTVKNLCIGDMKTVNFTVSVELEYIVGSLYPNTLYKFVVLARTADGWSEDSRGEFESTMPSAPSGPPQNVKIIDVNDTTIYLYFEAPLVPNGRISHYLIYYGPATPTESMKQELDFQVGKSSTSYTTEIKNCLYFANYSVEIKACVDLACSQRSPPVYALTGIGSPGKMETPHIEIFNSSLVNISWKSPETPNGPIHMYVVLVAWQNEKQNAELKSEIEREIFNVSGHENHLEINVTCPLTHQEDNNMYFFSVQAVNLKDGFPLYGPPSDLAQTRLCLSRDGIQPPYALILGLAVGGALGMGCLVIVIYTLAKWMKKEVDNIKGITVILPNGLDSPSENTLSTYDTFKNGLQKNHDSGIPSEINYARLCSFGDGQKLARKLKNSNSISSEELVLKKSGRENSQRNHSGESNISNKGHDSISLSNTNRTHLSFDSGAEVDLPPSPDGVFSETSSSNTTPRSYKPDLAIVKEINASSSRDSGLDKEVAGGASPEISAKNVDLSSRFAWYVKKRNLPYSNLHFRKSLPQMQPYSKFAVITPASLPAYIPVGGHSLGLLDCSLANSEPSVADFEGGCDSEPLMFAGVPPYCRFGIARSAGNNLNLTSQILPGEQNFGYSKFGIIYRPMKRENETNVNDFSYVPLGMSKLNEKTLPVNCKMGNSSELYEKQTFSSCFPDLVCRPDQFSVCHSSNSKQINVSPISTYDANIKTLPTCSKINSIDTTSKGGIEESVSLQTGNSPYSKFSIQSNTGKPVSRNGYVSFYDTLNNASSVSVPKEHEGMAYSKFSLNCNKEDGNALEENHNLSEIGNKNAESHGTCISLNTDDDDDDDEYNSVSNTAHVNHIESHAKGNHLKNYIPFQDAKLIFSDDQATPTNSVIQNSNPTSIPAVHDDPILDCTKVKPCSNSSCLSEQHPSYQETDDSSIFKSTGSKQFINPKNEVNAFPNFMETGVSCLPENLIISSSKSDVITPDTYTEVQDYVNVPEINTDVSTSPNVESHRNNSSIAFADNELSDATTILNYDANSENHVDKPGKNGESKKINLTSNGYVTLSELAGLDVATPQTSTQIIVVPSLSTLSHSENV